MLRWSLVCVCVTGALAAAVPGGAGAYSPQESPRGRQLLYVHQPYSNRFAPQPQRLELSVENPEAQYYQLNQQSQDIRTYSDKETKGAPAKLETLEPDAELLPGVQAQGQQPQAPPAQVPVAAGGIPGLLPGQRVYIVHPQHQIFSQAPLYPGLPNGYRPNVQVPGYQRFYIVQAQPGVEDGNYPVQAGYQNAILIDPSTGQPLASPQYLQQNFQRLVAVEPPRQPSSAPNKNYAEPDRNQEANGNYPERSGNYIEANRNSVEPSRNYAGPLRVYQESQRAELVGAQPQYRPAFSGLPAAVQPFFGYGRPLENFYQQQAYRNDLQLNPNGIQFSPPPSLQRGQFPGAPAPPPPQGSAVSPAGATGEGAVSAQGRADTEDYSEEDRKEGDDISTEANTFEKSAKNTGVKSAESAPEESSEPKEEADKAQLKTPKETANIQTVPKRT